MSNNSSPKYQAIVWTIKTIPQKKQTFYFNTSKVHVKRKINYHLKVTKPIIDVILNSRKKVTFVSK